jgi:inner membrane protein
MDSLTQLTLGAAIGGAVGGAAAGRKGILWGAAAGTLPDLDILAYPFLTPPQELAFHRGPSHALWFGFVAAVPLALLARRLHFQSAFDVSLRRWYVLFALCLFTHPLLDALTIYGTQLLWPISTTPLEWATLFIIDPLYTLPLLTGVIWMLARPRSSGLWANRLGLILSTSYLIWTISAKLVVEARFDEALAAEGHEAERSLTAPMPLQTLLWMGLADTGDSVRVAVHSLRDDVPIRYEAIAQRTELLEPYFGQPALERLRWFTHEYWIAERRGGDLIVHDPRFGRLDGWYGLLGPNADESLAAPPSYVFSFRLIFDPDDPTRVVSFEQLPQVPDVDGEAVEWLVDRVTGVKGL